MLVKGPLCDLKAHGAIRDALQELQQRVGKEVSPAELSGQPRLVGEDNI